MGGLLVIAVVGIASYLFMRHRILDSFTDPVTRSNRDRLGRMLLMLVGGFLGFLLLMSMCARS